jgi:hypothetical protein
MDNPIQLTNYSIKQLAYLYVHNYICYSSLIYYYQRLSFCFGFKMVEMDIKREWQQCDTKVFWGDIAPDDHVIQIYDNDAMLINTLADYASHGFDGGDSVIIIATANHLKQLNERLFSRGCKLDILIENDQYIPLDAEQTLAKFMVNGSPNEKYFLETITPIMEKARGDGRRRIMAFGEMVALLWDRGNSKATMQLEQLWNNLCAVENFCLFCAYPRDGFTQDASATVMHICSAHSKLVATDEKLPSQIQYKAVV